MLLTAFLSLAACALVLATGVKSTERFTIHIGSRLPLLSWVAFSQDTFKRMKGAGSAFSNVRSDQPLAGLVSL